MLRSSLVIALLAVGSTQALAQQSPAPVQAPTPPRISMPEPAPAPAQVPTADDVMTLGRPPSSPTSVSQTPVVQRPQEAPQPIGTSSASSPSPSALPGPSSGLATVFDGNTLVVGGMVFVLNGADAPEPGQVCLDLAGAPWRCGEKAKKRLAEVVGSSSVRCIPLVSVDGGYAATCWSGRDDIASIMVREGLAVVPEGVASSYGSEEGAARAARRGVWSGSFEKPWVLRARM